MNSDDFSYDKESRSYIAADSTWRITIRNTFREEIDLHYLSDIVKYNYSANYYTQNGNLWISVRKEPDGVAHGERYPEESIVFKRLVAVLKAEFGEHVHFEDAEQERF